MRGIRTESASLETYIHIQGAATIGNSMGEYLEKIASFAQQALSHVSARLANDVARCRLVWDAYHGSTGVVCVYFLDAFVSV